MWIFLKVEAQPSENSHLGILLEGLKQHYWTLWMWNRWLLFKRRVQFKSFKRCSQCPGGLIQYVHKSSYLPIYLSSLRIHLRMSTESYLFPCFSYPNDVQTFTLQPTIYPSTVLSTPLNLSIYPSTSLRSSPTYKTCKCFLSISCRFKPYYLPHLPLYSLEVALTVFHYNFL